MRHRVLGRLCHSIWSQLKTILITLLQRPAETMYLLWLDGFAIILFYF